MFVLTIDDVILAISPIARQLENGIFTGNAIYAMPNITIHEVSDVPESVKPQVYCYNETQGFFKNPNYKPYKPVEDRVAALEAQLAETRAALDFILFGGI